ncbi:MAG: hypothetical protein HOQ05_11540 [Corynebacteriales bacterium]|nr:hypothetical protein [Mycobacteriales bacterium]
MTALSPGLGGQPILRVWTLGPMRVSYGASSVNLGSARLRAFFARLVLRPHVTAGPYELLDAVWGAEPPQTGLKIIPVYVYRLRQALQAVGGASAADLLVRDRDGYRFSGTNIWTDALRVDEIVSQAEDARVRGDEAMAGRAYAEALTLFAGEPLTGLSGPFAEGERHRLTERRLAVFQSWIESELKLGQFATAVGALAAAVVEQPYSESLAVLLMRALYAQGRRADALDVFTRTRCRLVDELGVEPGEDLRHVHEAILRDDVSVVSAPGDRPHGIGADDSLPAGADALIGRDRELALLAPPQDMRGVRVDAINGIAGVGKTALAVCAARRDTERYPDGSLFLDLLTHSQGQQPVTLCEALRQMLRAVGAQEHAGVDSVDELASYWRAATADLRLQLVLDDVCSVDQVRSLLPTGSGSRVLVTSRSRLTGLEAHRRISLSTLEYDAAADLLEVLVGNGRINPRLPAVRKLVKLVDALPLAVRALAAQLRASPIQAVDNLVSRLAERCELLGELMVGEVSLQAALATTYERLGEHQRRVFHMLGIVPSVVVDVKTISVLLDLAPGEVERLLEE